MRDLNKHKDSASEKERTTRSLFATIVFYSDFNLANRSHARRAGDEYIGWFLEWQIRFPFPSVLLALIAVPN